jgi:hypothetical protein
VTACLPASALRRTGDRLPALAFVLAASVLVASFARWGPDWPAQEFRAWIAGHDGLSWWTMRWYGGAALPGYSVLYPPLAAVLGPGLVGVASCVAATWIATGLAPRTSRTRALCFDFAVAASVVQNLWIGQLPFLVGVAFGVAALRCLLHGRAAWTVGALAALSSLASPLAGAFLVLALPAVALARTWRAAAPLAAALAGSVVAAVVGGAGGRFPCPSLTFLGVAGFCALAAVVAPRELRCVRVFAACYLLVDLAAFVVPNPVGGNVVRLARLVALPMACWLLRSAQGQWRRTRTVGLAGVVAVAIAWPAVAFASSMVSDSTDPSRNATFYSGLVGYLHDHRAGATRIEIPFTREHWESYFVARSYPIARGWERQSDLQYNAVLYQPLTAQRYRRWLDDNAITLVALPHTSMDVGGRAEAALLRRPPAYLVPVWHDAHWQVWRVAHATPLVTGAATLLHQQDDALTLRFRTAGAATVRVHASALWVPSRPGSCVTDTAQGWLRVMARRPGIVRLNARLNADVLTGPDGCR